MLKCDVTTLLLLFALLSSDTIKYSCVILKKIISAQLRLGPDCAIPCKLLIDDPHGEDTNDDDDDDDDDAGVHLADPQPRHLEIHHDQVPQPRTGRSGVTTH